MRTFEQDRRLAYLQLRDDEPTWIYDTLRFTLFCQIQEEDQYAVSKWTDNKKTWDGFDVVTPGFNAELMKETELGTFVYGLDYSRDIVDTYNRENKKGVPAERIQGPVADNSSCRHFRGRPYTAGRPLRSDTGCPRHLRARHC
jgi:hypothetical protein